MSDLLRHLVAKLEEERVIIANDAIRGNSRDYAAYKELCGISKGLQKAIYIIDEAAQKLIEDEDNE